MVYNNATIQDYGEERKLDLIDTSIVRVRRSESSSYCNGESLNQVLALGRAAKRFLAYFQNHVPWTFLNPLRPL
jgi:hypothetical protein